MRQAQFDQTFAGWREEARKLLKEHVHPSQIHWGQEALSLFGEEEAPAPVHRNVLRMTVPPEFITLAETVSYARDEDRWALLYRILYRLQFESAKLLEIKTDSDILRLENLAKSVRRDIHKMHAFVRFKKSKVVHDEILEDHYVAWHKPEHLIVRAAASFFERRFGDKRFSIFTPEESVHWDLKELRFGPGMTQNEFEVKDDWDEVWKTYYKSIFNPARIKIKAMKQEMSPKYWSALPEAALINEMVREAPQQLQKMADNQFRAAEVDLKMPLPELKAAAATCQSCPIHLNATQTVFGVGPQHAGIMIVGEQPGDNEDLEGLPFVGPAGEVLNEALMAAGLTREDLYLTNAVKHFKWQRSGKKRLHQKPSGSEMHACRPWLMAEVENVKPKVILALGVTAATSIIGKQPRLNEERGQPITVMKIAPYVVLSWHPSAILRAATPEGAARMKQELVEDLRLVAELAARSDSPELTP